MSREPELKRQNNNNDSDACPKGDCTGVLNQLWIRQILTRQVESERAYAKRHSLELALAPKLFSSKVADRSNGAARVA